jgi:hypothetical protein
MKGKLLEILKKKAREGKTIDKNSKEYKAKEDVLNEIKELMSESIAGKLKGMKKVTVAADTVEGLKAGLEKAEDVIEAKEESSGKEEMLDKLKKLAEEKAKKE